MYLDAFWYLEEVIKTNKGRLALIFELMRYHYEKPETYRSRYGRVYTYNHPVYDRCTLFEIGDRGLSVIQQRYDERYKVTYWSEVDPWLTDELYLHAKFKQFFDERAARSVGGYYPTVTIRQIIWALRMKPLPIERWETCFDRIVI